MELFLEIIQENLSITITLVVVFLAIMFDRSNRKKSNLEVEYATKLNQCCDQEGNRDEEKYNKLRQNIKYKNISWKYHISAEQHQKSLKESKKIWNECCDDQGNLDQEKYNEQMKGFYKKNTSYGGGMHGW